MQGEPEIPTLMAQKIATMIITRARTALIDHGPAIGLHGRIFQIVAIKTGQSSPVNQLIRSGQVAERVSAASCSRWFRGVPMTL